jgi:hypothetical protein
MTSCLMAGCLRGHASWAHSRCSLGLAFTSWSSLHLVFMFSGLKYAGNRIPDTNWTISKNKSLILLQTNPLSWSTFLDAPSDGCFEYPQDCKALTITLRTTSLTFKNYTWCSHCVYALCMDLRTNLHNINRLVLHNRGGECLLCGTHCEYLHTTGMFRLWTVKFLQLSSVFVKFP